ncbi:MAG: hypothetical protein ABII09_01440 [Planctomycetota bacterium]
MQNERVIRAVAFVVFFSIGAAVLSATVLCDVFLEYFHNRSLLKQAEEGFKKIENLDADYDVVIGQLEGDPCQLARLAPATLGIEPNEPNTVFPRASADKLAAAREALSEEPEEPVGDEAIPEWLGLCCQWPRRHILFFCGAALVLISFIFFGPAKRSRRSITVTSKTEVSEPPGAKK